MRVLSFLRRFFVPDTALKALKAPQATTRVMARLYIAAQPITLILILWAFWWEPNGLRVVTYDYDVPPQMAEWRGRTVAVLADLHAGSPWIDDRKIGKVVDMTLAAKPDIILLTGDYMTHSVPGGTYMPPEEIASHLKRLEAPLGVYAVLGNHDHWDGAAAVMRALRGVGFIVLEDESRDIPGTDLWVAGLSDYTEGRLNYHFALKNVPEGMGALCVTHQPDSFPVLPDACLFTVAGHTHGGQVKLPFLGTPVVPSRYGDKFVKGFVTEEGRTIFVSSGIGTSIFPVRFRVPPEISVIRMK